MEKQTIVIFDLDNHTFEVNYLKSPLTHNYKNPYIYIAKHYQHTTSADQALKDTIKDISKLIDGLLKYRKGLIENTVVIANLTKKKYENNNNTL